VARLCGGDLPSTCLFDFASTDDRVERVGKVLFGVKWEPRLTDEELKLLNRDWWRDPKSLWTSEQQEGVCLAGEWVHEDVDQQSPSPLHDREHCGPSDKRQAALTARDRALRRLTQCEKVRERLYRYDAALRKASGDPRNFSRIDLEGVDLDELLKTDQLLVGHSPVQEEAADRRTPRDDPPKRQKRLLDKLPPKKGAVIQALLERDINSEKDIRARGVAKLASELAAAKVAGYDQSAEAVNALSTMLKRNIKDKDFSAVK
jgi:hypothetical protein